MGRKLNAVVARQNKQWPIAQQLEAADKTKAQAEKEKKPALRSSQRQ